MDVHNVCMQTKESAILNPDSNIDLFFFPPEVTEDVPVIQRLAQMALSGSGTKLEDIDPHTGAVRQKLPQQTNKQQSKNNAWKSGPVESE